MSLTAFIDGEEISRERVLSWELNRAHKVLRFLGAELIPGEDVAQARTRLLAVKRQLGPTELERRLTARLAVSDRVSSLSAKAVQGKRSVSSARIVSTTGSAQDFATWFEAECATDNSDAMLSACPDHYVLGDSDRGQMVIETTGGAPLPSRFYINYADLSSLTTQADPAFPIQVAGVARNKQGVPPDARPR